jgi:hypothetical protein
VIVCPLCEHQQASGEECDACGIKFSKDLAIPVAIPALEGLEPTQLAQSDELPSSDLADWIEPTSARSVESPAASIIADLEPTRLAGTDVPSSLDMLPADSGDPLPGDGGWFEPTFVESLPDEPPETTVLICRYCREPAQADQLMCARCGMKLPVWKPDQPDAGDERPICQSCGTPSAGEVCRSCGVRMQQTEP